MNSSYFFGNRVGLNKGGRASFNTGGPGFYNEADQKLYEDFQFLPQEQYRLGLGNTTTTEPSDVEQTGIMSQVPIGSTYIPPYESEDFRGGGKEEDDDSTNTRTGKFGLGDLGTALGFITNPIGMIIGKGIKSIRGARGMTGGLFGSRGVDKFGNKLNEGDVEVDMPTTITPTNSNDFDGQGSQGLGGGFSSSERGAALHG
jgi:hypothetical protein